jgi:MFS family permease
MATLQYVQDIVPNSVRTTAITAFTACSGGIGGFFGNICGGIIIQYINVFILFKVMSAMCIIAFIIGCSLKLYSSRRTKDEILEKVY